MEMEQMFIKYAIGCYFHLLSILFYCERKMEFDIYISCNLYFNVSPSPHSWLHIYIYMYPVDDSHFDGM